MEMDINIKAKTWTAQDVQNIVAAKVKRAQFQDTILIVLDIIAPNNILLYHRHLLFIISHL